MRAELLRLQTVGNKTVAILWRQARIRLKNTLAQFLAVGTP